MPERFLFGQIAMQKSQIHNSLLLGLKITHLFYILTYLLKSSILTEISCFFKPIVKSYYAFLRSFN